MAFILDVTGAVFGVSLSSLLEKDKDRNANVKVPLLFKTVSNTLSLGSNNYREPLLESCHSIVDILKENLFPKRHFNIYNGKLNLNLLTLYGYRTLNHNIFSKACFISYRNNINRR